MLALVMSPLQGFESKSYLVPRVPRCALNQGYFIERLQRSVSVLIFTVPDILS